jgi:lipopolysaccharide transport system ATP-binding protein
MASDIAISVEGLSKRYLVGHNDKVDPNATLRDQIARSLRGLARKTGDMARGRQIVQGDSVEEFWALKDVSFDIPRGARVGILGRNGAGKSTLLKLLSRITEPTSGRIQIRGRVASLLEVGTGFHPELTGRENIFLNGAILGMSRREIQSKFDEIVDFADISNFIDTPVKRYSSGMYVRLAFAVAAHLQSEILVVDEVLAVGDAQFQRKCLGKMGDISADGRTVLFVSHNIEAISNLCTTGVLLQGGTVSSAGSITAVVEAYLASIRQSMTASNGRWSTRTPEEAGVRRVQVIQNDLPTGGIICGQPFEIHVLIRLDRRCHDLDLGFGFKDEEGRDILRLNNKHINQNVDWPKSGDIEVKICIPHFNWIQGSEVILGVYFGHIDGRYQSLEDLIPLRLTKNFTHLPTEKIVSRLNKIFVDGISYR